MKLTKVGRTADKLTQVEHSEKRIVWSEACLPNSIHELTSGDLKRCIPDAHLGLIHDVYASMDIFWNALYGAAACVVRTVGEKRSVR